jgi:hypothetical protein
MEMHISWIELSLLVLEGLLLIFTVALLLLSIKEGRGRDSLILEVSKATKTLTQHEYFITIMDAMVDAEKDVIGVITGRMPQGDEGKRTKEIVLNIEKLRDTGVKVTYVMPRFQDRLHVGWRYTKAGAEVYYSSCAHVHDLRYMVVDGNVSILGVPESVGEKEATKKGYRIPSEGLGLIMKNSFMGCLNDSVSYGEFVRETIKQTGAPVKTLARELNIPEAELERINSSPAA